MKKSIIIISLLIVFYPLFSVTVDGYAFLEGETDHSGIEVFLQRTAPDTNYSYTVYSDSTGYYNSVIESGVYNITYDKLQFDSQEFFNVILYSDSTLADVTMIFDNSLFGSISGVLSRGIYSVPSTLAVDFGDSLIIEPGVILEFDTGVEFRISGTLIAEGVLNDSIKFTALNDSWDGIVGNRSEGGKIGYCIIEKTTSQAVFNATSIFNSSIRNNFGNGLYQCGPLIENCDFSNNSQYSILSDANIATIKNCNFTNNNASAIFSQHGSNVNIENCTIQNNTGYYGSIVYYDTIGKVDSCLISQNTNIHGSYGILNGSGITICISDSVVVQNSIIDSNTTANRGGGIFVYDSEVTIIGCDVSNNISTGTYTDLGGASGIISLGGSNLSIIDTKIYNNQCSGTTSHGGGVYVGSGTTNIENSIIVNNYAPYGAGISNKDDLNVYNSIISGNSGHGIYTTATCDIHNSIINANTNYGIYNFNASISQNILFNNIHNNIPSNSFQVTNLGMIVTTNNNGDPCDPWYNISMDPVFVSVGASDFRIAKVSPCRDAGDNIYSSEEWDIRGVGFDRKLDEFGNPGTVDIGPYEWNLSSDPLTSIQNSELTVDTYELHQNYPNPFNPETTINYSLMNNAQVNLKVYDIAGREIYSLVDNKQNKGLHEVKFDGSMLTSGIYFYQLSIDGKAVENRKMMLLK